MIRSNRKSGIELMRCLCMIMIIGYHYVQHSTNSEFQLITDSMSFNHLIAVLLGNWGGSVGVLGFIVITCYFSNEDTSFNVKRILNIILQTWLYCVFFALIGYGFHVFSLKEFAQELLTPIYGQYWFITAYIIFSFIIPFLQKVVSSISYDELKKLVLLLTVFIPIYDAVFSGNFGTIACFVYIYFLIQWIKKSDKVEGFISKNGMKVFFIVMAILLLASYVITITGSALNNPSILKMTMMINNKNLITIIVAIAMFYGFKKLSIKNIVINKFGKATFGIYIIHENILMWHGQTKMLWNEILHVQDYLFTNIFPLHMIFSILIVFLIAGLLDMVLDLIRSKWFNIVYSCKIIKSVICKIDYWFNEK